MSMLNLKPKILVEHYYLNEAESKSAPTSLSSDVSSATLADSRASFHSSSPLNALSTLYTDSCSALSCDNKSTLRLSLHVI